MIRPSRDKYLDGVVVQIPRTRAFLESGPLESAIRNLRIQTLKAQLNVCQLVCASLAKEIQSSSLTLEEKAALAHRWGKALNETRGLQHAIDTLEQQEVETRATAM